jgi:F0F1-type ATP synthase membrane subunit b/b'
MINLDEKAWFAICFIIFFWLAYRPIRNFILSILDSNISKVQREFYNANNILQDSRINLDKANKNLQDIIALSSNLKSDISKTLEKDLLNIKIDFEATMKRLYMNHELEIKNLSNNYINIIKQEIIEESFKKIIDKFQSQAITTSNQDIIELIKLNSNMIMQNN